MPQEDRLREVARAICCPKGCMGPKRQEQICSASFGLYDEQAQAVIDLLDRKKLTPRPKEKA